MNNNTCITMYNLFYTNYYIIIGCLFCNHEFCFKIAFTALLAVYSNLDVALGIPKFL